MLDCAALYEILRNYDKNRRVSSGWWDDWLDSQFGEREEIRRIRRFSSNLSLSSNQVTRELTANEIFRLVRILMQSKKKLPVAGFARSLSLRPHESTLNEILQALKIDDIVPIMQQMEQAGILDEANFRALRLHKKHRAFADILHKTYALGLLNQQRFDAIKVHPNIAEVKEAVATLIKEHSMSVGVVGIVSVLLAATILGTILAITIVSFSLVFLSLLIPLGLLPFFPIIFVKLKQAFSMPKEKTLDAMLTAEKPQKFMIGYKDLSFMLRTDENREVLQSCEDPVAVAKMLKLLHSMHILTPKRRNLVKSIRHVNQVVRLVKQLSFRDRFIPRDFDSLFKYIDIFTADEVTRLYERIPNHLITRNFFDRIIACGAQPNGGRALREYFNELIGVEEQAINGAQSTHTVSVHKSVSDSAKNLMEKYGDKVRPNNVVLHEILQWSETLGSIKAKTKAAAARRAIVRMTKKDYQYMDRESGVTTQELFSLAWLLMHEEGNIIKIADAINLFIEALYECQREYNFDSKGCEKKLNKKGNYVGKDAPACAPAVFNKIMEKLQNVNPEIKVIFMTKETANLKLSRVVVAEAKDYLRSQYSVLNADAFDVLLTSVAEDIAVPDKVWSSIRPKVEAIMREEFEVLFKKAEVFQEEDFQKFIAGGQCVEISSEEINQIKAGVIAAAKKSSVKSVKLDVASQFFKEPVAGVDLMFEEQSESEQLTLRM